MSCLPVSYRMRLFKFACTSEECSIINEGTSVSLVSAVLVSVWDDADDVFMEGRRYCFLFFSKCFLFNSWILNLLFRLTEFPGKWAGSSPASLTITYNWSLTRFSAFLQQCSSVRLSLPGWSFFHRGMEQSSCWEGLTELSEIAGSPGEWTVVNFFACYHWVQLFWLLAWQYEELRHSSQECSSIYLGETAFQHLDFLNRLYMDLFESALYEEGELFKQWSVLSYMT